MTKLTKNQQQTLKLYDSITPVIGKSVEGNDSRVILGGSATAEECFFHIETHGKPIAIAEGQEQRLVELLSKKASYGLQVKQWAEDVASTPPIFPIYELVSVLIKNDFPRWVIQDVVGQARKIANERDGFCPSYVHSVPAEVVYDMLAKES